MQAIDWACANQVLFVFFCNIQKSEITYLCATRAEEMSNADVYKQPRGASAERFVREEKAHEMLEGIRNLRCE